MMEVGDENTWFTECLQSIYQFVKVSNESLEKGLPCTKIQVGEQKGHSRAIRKIQNDTFPNANRTSNAYIS